MTLGRRTWCIATAAVVALGMHAGPRSARAQDCEITPEGRICRVPQAITAGQVVDPETQRRLGLVTVNGGCSGTLLNRYWVLTARHCVTTTGRIPDPLLAPTQVRVTADWAPGREGLAKRIHDFAVNTAPGALPARDIVLVYLGLADLGPVDSQRILARGIPAGPGSTVLSGRLLTTDTVTQYGRGFSTYATGVFGGAPPAVPAAGLGVYRSAQFSPSAITATGYTLAMNASNQVGHGGDSGGPTVLTVNGVGTGIAGVQSTCSSAGYVTNAPAVVWQWATGISACQYVSTEPFWIEIRNAIRESPECLAGPACAMPPIIAYILD